MPTPLASGPAKSHAGVITADSPEASLVLLHGFTQTGACWEPLSTMLRGQRRVLCPDLPGHGEASSLHLDMWQSAEHLAALTGAEHLVGGVAPVLVGYSMGGRLALHAALAHPEHVGGLVLIGATPGIKDPEQRSQRLAADEALAQRIHAEGVDAFLDYWLALPLFGELGPERSHRAERERNTPAGLAGSLRRCGQGAQDSLWDRLGEITCAVMVITGDADTKFAGIADEMVALLGGPASHFSVADAGHAVHSERPEQTADVILSWLAGRE